jgi:hypothetical protein
MKKRVFQLGLLCLVSISGRVVLSDDRTTQVRLKPTGPAIEVDLRASDEAPFVLPDLQFDFEIHVSCAVGGKPRSLMLSIADSRKSVTGPDLLRTEPATLSMTVPSAQIAPVNVQGFCVTEVDRPVALGQSVNVPGFLSAQASLLCSAGTDEEPDAPDRIGYFSTALDITLVCRADGSGENEETRLDP